MDTKITKLRNMMGPIYNYFSLIKEEKEKGLDLSKFIKIELEKSLNIIDDVIDIIKEIPDDALDKNDYGISEVTGLPKCKDCDNDELNGWSSHCKSCGMPIVC